MESVSFKKIKKSQKTLIILVALAIFVGAFCYMFFMSGGSEKTTETVQTGQEDASYREYQDYISNTNNGVKNLLNGEQLKQIVVNEYPPIDLNLPRSENPFAKAF